MKCFSATSRIGTCISITVYIYPQQYCLAKLHVFKASARELHAMSLRLLRKSLRSILWPINENVENYKNNVISHSTFPFLWLMVVSKEGLLLLIYKFIYSYIFSRTCYLPSQNLMWVFLKTSNTLIFLFGLALRK